MALLVAFAACWWCSCTCLRWLWLVTTHNTIVSLSDKILTLLGLKHTSSSYTVYVVDASVSGGGLTHVALHSLQQELSLIA
jgi:hypothetical protein